MSRNKKLGYYFKNGKNRFHGAIGGERERLEGDILLTMAKNIIEPEEGNRKGFQVNGITRESQIGDHWRAAEGGRDFDQIPEKWKAHRGWWTLAELEVEIRGEEEEQAQQAQQDEDGGDIRVQDTGVERGPTQERPAGARTGTGNQRKRNDERCEACGKPGVDHGRGNRREISWIACDLCARWMVKRCAFKGEIPEEVEEKFWSCQRCIATQRKLETLVVALDDEEAGWKSIGKSIREVEGRLKKLEDVTTRKEKATEKAEEKITKCHEQIERLEGLVKEADRTRALMEEEKIDREQELNRRREENTKAEGETVETKIKIGRMEEHIREIESELATERERNRRLRTVTTDRPDDGNKPSPKQDQTTTAVKEQERHQSSPDQAYRMMQMEMVEVARREWDKAVRDPGCITLSIEPGESRPQPDRPPRIQEKSTPQAGAQVHVNGPRQEKTPRNRDTPRRRLAMGINRAGRLNKEKDPARTIAQEDNTSNKGREPEKRIRSGNRGEDSDGGKDRIDELKVGGRDDLSNLGENRENEAGKTTTSYYNEDHSYHRQKKRVLEEPKTPPKPKRRMTGGRTLFLGSSLFQVLARDSGLETTAYERGWDLRMIRGGHMKQIESLIESEEEVLEDYRWIVVCGGGNNLADVARRDPKKVREEIDHIVRSTRRIVRLGKKHRCQVMVMLPAPRKDVPERIRKEAVVELANAAVGEGAEVFQAQHGETAEEFVRELWDGIHYKKEHFREILTRLLTEIGEKTEVRGCHKKIRMHELFPGICCVCGTRHEGPEHTPFDDCEICRERSHATNVCLDQVKMCLRCGRRGHRMKRCTRGRGNQEL